MLRNPGGPARLAPIFKTPLRARIWKRRSGTAVSRDTFRKCRIALWPGPEILRDITFDIPASSFQFLTGPSGAGKTTLLKLLFLSLKPTRGLIRMFDRDIASIPREDLPMLRRRIGIVFQDFQLLDHLTTYENVSLPLRVRGKEEHTYRSDVIEL